MQAYEVTKKFSVYENCPNHSKYFQAKRHSKIVLNRFTCKRSNAPFYFPKLFIGMTFTCTFKRKNLFLAEQIVILNFKNSTFCVFFFHGEALKLSL